MAPRMSHAASRRHVSSSTSTPGNDMNSSSGEPATRWNTVRPWCPPSSSSSSTSGTLPTTDSVSDSARVHIKRQQQSHPSSTIPKLRLEVLDVSSTAVSLAIYAVSSSTSTASSAQSNSNSDPFDLSSHAVSVKLNGQPWQHVVHSDPSLWHDSPRGQSSDARDGQEATIILYGLEPGQEYEVELDIVNEQDEDDVHNIVLSQAEPIVSATTAAARDTSNQQNDEQAPHDPPPPYSSLDPSSSSSDGHSTSAATEMPSEAALLQQESQIKGELQALKEQAKTTENSLKAPLNAVKRNADKAHKEDIRTKQRISTLEEATRKIKESTAEDLVEAEAIQAEEVEPLGEELDSLSKTSAESRRRFNQVEKETKATSQNHDEAIKALEKELESLSKEEARLTSERLHYEGTLIPALIEQLASLDKEMQRVSHFSQQQSHFSQPPHLYNNGPYTADTYAAVPAGIGMGNGNAISAPPGLSSFSNRTSSSSNSTSRANSLRFQTSPSSHPSLTAGQSRVVDHAHAAQQQALEAYFAQNKGQNQSSQSIASMPSHSSIAHRDKKTSVGVIGSGLSHKHQTQSPTPSSPVDTLEISGKSQQIKGISIIPRQMSGGKNEA